MIIAIFVFCVLIAIVSIVYDKTNTVKAADKRPEPPLKPAPEGLFPKRPFLTDWLSVDGEYFKKEAVVAMTENPNKTVNVILNNGKSINTGLFIDEMKMVLGINFSCTVREELRHKKEMYGKQND